MADNTEMNGWINDKFIEAMMRTRERDRQRSPAKDFRIRCERMMRDELQPIQVRGLYHDGVWIDEMRHVEINRSASDALVYGLGVMNVTPAGIHYVPFDTIARAPKVSTLAKAVCTGLQVVPPDIHSVALIHNSATPKA